MSHKTHRKHLHHGGGGGGGEGGGGRGAAFLMLPKGETSKGGCLPSDRQDVIDLCLLCP